MLANAATIMIAQLTDSAQSNPADNAEKNAVPTSAIPSAPDRCCTVISTPDAGDEYANTPPFGPMRRTPRGHQKSDGQRRQCQACA